MDIVMTLEPHGWLDILVQPDQGEQIEIPVSFLSDAVEDIARQFVALHKGATEVTITMQTEPGEYRFWIKKRSQTMVQFMVYEMSDNFSTEAVTEGRLLMSEELTLVKLTKLFYRELSKMKEIGPEEYHKRWSFDFPLNAYERIERIVQIR
ncbi:MULTISPECIES: hypothetical protein [unclassified Paenibacillus]|uniref:hypothetical protein n=1 Tax=unclassified Paenibacillus TaxID=185978 RepID=UPI000CFADE36|nr:MULTISPECIES: hypothetical protein [unclassified Paenibacillus]PRA08721.1 hypothetical protein CQ043_01700 [Paenibacillus sp. MYb63]PRA48655.1 hypothetical protein CQ061_10155 [Paenibacillus sp. MYb67]